MDVIGLTGKLLSFNTISPPGNESEIAGFTGDLLRANGFVVKYHPFRKNRMNLIAEKGLSSNRPPLVFSGHFDTVPLGRKKWSVDPFKGEIMNRRIWGRGSSDMKGSLAAMILASVEAFEIKPPRGGIRLIISAAEEGGCQGITRLVSRGADLGKASALIVGEPSANIPVTGHKGALYLRVVFSGRTAHSSMPEMGVNAIYKAARAIGDIIDFKFEAVRDKLLGYPSINVGKIRGGMNINSVPDHAEFTIDLRTTTMVDHDEILGRLKNTIGSEAIVRTLVNLKPVYTPENDPFVSLVYDVCGIRANSNGFPKALPYLTDGAVLQRYYRGVPTIILGPGEPEMAHQTDESCRTDLLESAVGLYREIIIKWGQN